MSRRRTRFTVSYSPDVSDKIERVVVLAYDEAGAKQTVQIMRSPCIVLAIAPGDYRVKAQRSAQPRGGFRIDQAKLAEAIDLLGLEWPVKIAPNAKDGGSHGNHQIRYEGTQIKGGRIHGLDNPAATPYHRVMVKSYLTAEDASRTLWHELAHGMQAERCAKAAEATTAREIHTAWNLVLSDKDGDNRGVNYFAKPIEIEAREYEAFAADCPIAK
jgi:hypothetical protein